MKSLEFVSPDLSRIFAKKKSGFYGLVKAIAYVIFFIFKIKSRFVMMLI